MDTLWLGYDGLTVAFGEVVAVLLYQSAFDPRITQAYGSVPTGVRCVVVTTGRGYLPARWHADHVRQRWSHWRTVAAK